MKQLTLDIAPPPHATLVNFVPGHNTELLQTLDNMLSGREKERFVYLWGGAGCGKSHLLQAVAGVFMRNRKNTMYFACDEKTHFTVHSGQADCVLVDDVHHLNTGAQIGLFNLYNRLRDDDHAFFLITGPVAPAQLKLREDLVTRLGWGLVYQVHELTDEEKTEAMKSHATSRGVDLPQEVCDYLIRHERRDLPGLIATVDALDRYSLARRRKVTIPLVRELLQVAS